MTPLQHILIGLVRLYQWTLSPVKLFLFGPSGQCRFTPSCSQYAIEAVQTHGTLCGGWLSVKRVCRCHPWGDCGNDPVPARKVRREKWEVRTGCLEAATLATTKASK